MAEILQQDFSLPVVKVRLLGDASKPTALFELVVNVDGHQEVVAHQTHSLDSMGFESTEGRHEPDLHVPANVVAWIEDWVHQQLSPEDVLWLHLKKPYGLLGAVPWERDVQPAIGRPLLRLPDRLPSALRSGSTFHVALVATAPAEEGPSTAALQGPEVARALSDGLGDRLRLHVFGDPEAYDLLTNELVGLNGEVSIYKPEPVDDFTSKRDRRVQTNAWLEWIRIETRGSTLDAVHFITHGTALGDEGAILTTPSPISQERRYTQSIRPGDLRIFLTQVGALVGGFTRPPDNYSDYGLRRVVDDLGAVRAGPVLMHDDRFDPGMGALTEAYEFLASPEPAQPPASAGLTLFAQPRQVANISLDNLPEVTKQEAFASSAAVEEHFSRDETPVWLSAAERYIDESEADLIRFRQSKEARSPTRSQEAYYAGVENALVKIRALVNRHAEDEL